MPSLDLSLISVAFRFISSLKTIDVFARCGGNGDDGGAFEEPPLHQIFDLFGHQIDHVLIDEVLLCDRDNPPAYAEKLADVHVLPGLRHDRLIAGDDKEHHVDAPCPCHHVSDEPLMAGNVDDTDKDIFSEAIVGKPELDSDAPFFFLLEPVAVDAGKGLDERRLPVIDMARGAYHHLFHNQIILSRSKKVKALC